MFLCFDGFSNHHTQTVRSTTEAHGVRYAPLLSRRASEANNTRALDQAKIDELSSDPPSLDLQCIATTPNFPADSALPLRRAMEVDPLASHPPPRPRANTGSRQPPGRKLSNKGQNPLRGNGLREGRFRKSPPRPLGKEPESTFKTKARLSPGAGPKPLLPVSERRSGEDGKAGKTRKDAEGEKWDITPDGGSAGREGRHFTVANVGNNGKIYLR